MSDFLSRISCQHELEDLFDRALENRDIWPALQPIVCLNTGTIEGYEVLARWTAPSGIDISPARFIPKLKEAGLLDKLAIDLLDIACRASVQRPGDFYLSFNLAPTQLSQPDLADRLLRTVDRTRFSTTRVHFELTEQMAIPNESVAYSTFTQLMERGVKLAIDDFGVDHSNFVRLDSLPFQILKIDAQLVNGMSSSSMKRSMVRVILDLCKDLHLTSVGEGVESSEDAEALRELGCDLAQGFHFGRPRSMSDTEFEKPTLVSIG
ncbi:MULTISPECIES: EAL domain-containing protein [unclassified Leucobacter]|uniref:EAL domain-containing protein n=1 Tax=unclassified Leucobacter TaxID=2621730 RepID=UPI00301A2A6C